MSMIVTGEKDPLVMDEEQLAGLGRAAADLHVARRGHRRALEHGLDLPLQALGPVYVDAFLARVADLTLTHIDRLENLLDAAGKTREALA